MRRIRSTALVLSFAAIPSLGCDSERSQGAETAPLVGRSPLRRMSNGEYLNALGDLFPDVHVDLPELPQDTLVAGFENAAEAQKPSDVRIARFESIAILYSREATRDSLHVRRLAGCEWDSPAKVTECANHFVETTGRRLFRRPLLAAERDRFVSKLHGWRATIDFEAAVRLTLAAMLQSPQFLYRPEPETAGQVGAVVPLDGYAMASRLSFFLWESVPDDAGIDAAEHGRLGTAEGVRAEAERMLGDERARRVYWSFHRQWLGLGRISEEEHSVRTAEVDADWTAATSISARKESQLFVENVLSAGGTFEDLFTSRRAWIDGEMARIYGVRLPPTSGFSETSLKASERAGLLTRVAFLGSTSHRGATSPPIRGNALQLRLLCQAETPPPPGVDLSPPKSSPTEGPKTNRMLFEERTSPQACRGCHEGLNGFGFGFEHYSASGAYQKLDHGLPVDARGNVIGTDVDRAFDGPLELSETLARSRAVRRCATLQWTRYALGRTPEDIELPAIDALTDSFLRDGHVRAFLLELVTSPSFRMRRLRGPT